MKKIITFILVFGLLVSTLTGFAEETDGYKKALTTVKERIGNTDEYDDFSGHVYSDELGTSYSFSWNGSDKSLSITITEGGVVTNYDTYKKSNESVPISERLTKNEAEIRVKELFKKINPAIADSVVFSECRATHNGFRFVITRIQNGYRVKDNNGTISMDAMGNEIEFFYLNYDESCEFQDGNVIAKDDAMSAFNNKLGFELRYVSQWKSDERIISAVYEPVDHGFNYISAYTGELIELIPDTADYKHFSTNAMSDMAFTEAAGVAFSEAEISELEEIELGISESDAVSIIKNCKYFNLPSAFFEKYNIGTYNIDDKTRGYYFRYNSDNEFARIRINAQTGDILHYSKNTSDAIVKYTTEQAEETADETFKALAGDLYKEYKMDENHSVGYIPFDNSDEQKTSSFLFVRYVNGIPFYDDSLNITVDLSDNSVVNYSINHSNIDFPALDGIVDIHEASDIYFNNAGFEPVYIYDKDNYKLVYDFIDEHVSIDAFTGKNTSREDFLGYTDVSGHYCENIVNSLVELGIGFESHELKPDEQVKQKEFAALLNHCVKYNSSLMLNDDYDFKSLYDTEIISIIEDETERNPDGYVSRLDAAKFMVSAMGLGDIGKLDIYRPMFLDMNHAGYVSILCGLKIMNGDGIGNFNPDGILTRGQALIIIYNFLNM